MIEAKNIPTLTVFTPTYNRAYCLHQCYESLLRQTSYDFEWLIIDDGSNDNTRELVYNWINETSKFTIRYLYKINGGMHTAHNLAYENIYTELNICIDSDDYMPDNAVEKILKFWEKEGNDRYAGIIGLDATFDGKIIGTRFNNNIKNTTLSDFYAKGGKGDKKLVYRTELMKKYPPYPTFNGEKYVGLNYKYILCDQEYELLTLNEVLCYVEYQDNGSSRNMFKQYLKNPKGFAFLRKVNMKYSLSNKRKFIICIHYVSSSIISKNKYFIKESPKKVFTILAIPFGILLTLYIYFYNFMKNK